MAKNNRSKSAWTNPQRKRSVIKQFGWLFSGITGPICARSRNVYNLQELNVGGHHDWPVMPTNQPQSSNGALSMLWGRRVQLLLTDPKGKNLDENPNALLGMDW